MRIIGFCDFNSNDLNDQIETANHLDITNMLIRKVNNLKVSEFDSILIKEINKITKDNKKNILVLDPLIKSYDLYQLETFEETKDEYEKVFLVANQLKVTSIVFRLPSITNILDEFQTLKKQLDEFIDLAKKYKVTLLIQPEEEKTNVLVYILKHYKKRDLSLIFDPRQTVINKESPVVAYRLLKDYFNFIYTGDVDKKDNPELLGYGRVKIIDLFKRMNRDQYKGYLIIDDHFSKFLTVDETKKVPWYKKLFNKSDSQKSGYLRGYSLRIFPKEEARDITIFDIYENQINVLKIAFNIKN